ncbi:hypothetical protein Tcan_14850 [Toxocara canis]|uniref:Uncharacterized protein n=1 Tax=Toxocara canis TaxID=6265 RepID=A0A0B2VL08_TOXCA|nr:hypothetical protein Tcan_14850 [Toxocara canis]
MNQSKPNQKRCPVQRKVPPQWQRRKYACLRKKTTRPRAQSEMRCVLARDSRNDSTAFEETHQKDVSLAEDLCERPNGFNYEFPLFGGSFEESAGLLSRVTESHFMPALGTRSGHYTVKFIKGTSEGG